MDSLFGAVVNHVGKAMTPKEPDYKKHGRERREESQMKDKQRLKSDMAVQTARRIRDEEKQEAESRRRYAEYEQRKAADEARAAEAARQQRVAAYDRELKQNQAAYEREIKMINS